MSQRDQDDEGTLMSRSTLSVSVLSFAYARGFYVQPPFNEGLPQETEG